MKATTTDEATAPSGNLTLKRALVIGGVAIAAILITLITILLILNSLGGTRHEGVGAAPGVSVQTFITVPAENAFPTGMVRSADGTFYITAFGTGIIFKAAPDGTLTPWLDRAAGVTAPASLQIAPDGSIYLIDFTSAKPGSAVGAIKRITPDGKVNVYANTQDNLGLSFLSHLAFDGQGNLYVTYTARQEVWRFPVSGEGAAWLKLSAAGNTRAQPTGIVYDAANNAMIVADVTTGTIYRAKIRADGSADQPLVLYRQAGLTFQGLTYDANGQLLVAAWAQDNGQVARIDAEGKFTLLAQGFRAPTDIVAANGKIYVVNSDLPGLVPVLRAKPPFTIDVISESAATPTK